MVHVSQIMNDFVSYDQKNCTFNGRESKRVPKEKDTLRARIISVSLAARQYKIGLTTRQFGLGVDNWIEGDKKRLKERPKAGSARPGAGRDGPAARGRGKGRDRDSGKAKK